MSNKMPEVLDKRLVDRFVQRGLLKRDVVNSVLAKLPDLEGQADDIAGIVFGDGEEETAADEAEAPVEGAEGEAVQSADAGDAAVAGYREATIVPVDSPETPVSVPGTES